MNENEWIMMSEMSEDIRIVVRTVRWSPQSSEAVVFVDHSYNFPVKSESTNKCRMFKRILIGYSKILLPTLPTFLHLLEAKSMIVIWHDQLHWERYYLATRGLKTSYALLLFFPKPQKALLQENCLAMLHLVCSLPVPYILCSSLFFLPICDVILCPLTVNVVTIWGLRSSPYQIRR